MTAVRLLVDKEAARGSRGSGNKKLLSPLPTIVSMTSDFLNHIMKLKTYNQLNSIEEPLQMKLLLVASLDDAARLRISSFNPNVPPYDDLSFDDFIEVIRAAYLPKSHQKNYRAVFKERAQKPA